MDHGRHIQLHQFLEEWVPRAVRHWLRSPVSTGRVRVQVAADESQLFHATFKFLDGIPNRLARRLRQLADTGKALGIELHDAMDEIIADPCPCLRSGFVTEVVAHADRSGGEYREVDAALAHRFQLVGFDAFADRIVADLAQTWFWHARVAQTGQLDIAKSLKWPRRGRIMPVAINDHGFALALSLAADSQLVLGLSIKQAPPGSHIADPSEPVQVACC